MCATKNYEIIVAIERRCTVCARAHWLHEPRGCDADAAAVPMSHVHLDDRNRLIASASHPTTTSQTVRVIRS